MNLNAHQLVQQTSNNAINIPRQSTRLASRKSVVISAVLQKRKDVDLRRAVLLRNFFQHQFYHSPSPLTFHYNGGTCEDEYPEQEEESFLGLDKLGGSDMDVFEPMAIMPPNCMHYDPQPECGAAQLLQMSTEIEQKVPESECGNIQWNERMSMDWSEGYENDTECAMDDCATEMDEDVFSLNYCPLIQNEFFFFNSSKSEQFSAIVSNMAKEALQQVPVVGL